MTINIGINGMGRIGRMIIRAITESQNKNVKIKKNTISKKNKEELHSILNKVNDENLKKKLINFSKSFCERIIVGRMKIRSFIFSSETSVAATRSSASLTKSY